MPKAVGTPMKSSLEFDLHASRRLDDTGGNDKHDRKGKSKKDDSHARERRPCCNGSTPQGDGHEIEDSIPPLGNCNSQSANGPVSTEIIKRYCNHYLAQPYLQHKTA